MQYRTNLPQLSPRLFLTDGGIETTLIFHEGLELPYFAAFHLLRDELGRAALRRYFDRYMDIARTAGLGFILESPTWRASADWGRKLGYSDSALSSANRQAIALMAEIRTTGDTVHTPVVISGCIGPRGDGYDPGRIMSVPEAEDYHSAQIATFSGTEADMVTAITMSNAEEATGIARAAKAAGMPVVISFTLETDGRLPTGQPLAEAIRTVDERTGEAPAYYMVNCAHPTHFASVLACDAQSFQRLRGLRANASKRSHAELDCATDLDDGDPVALGREYRELRTLLPQLTILGGCCGTDHRHVVEICRACAQSFGQSPRLVA